MLIADKLGDVWGLDTSLSQVQSEGILGVSWTLLIPHSSRLFQRKDWTIGAAFLLLSCISFIIYSKGETWRFP